MNETFSVVKNFVQSLENRVLNTDQEAVLFVGETDGSMGLGGSDYDNEQQCKGSGNSNCKNGNCPMSTNQGTCINTWDCAYANNNGSCTGGGSGTGGTKGMHDGVLGFPGFEF